MGVSTAAPEVDKRRRLPGMLTDPRWRPRADLSWLVLVLIVGLAAPVIVRALGLDGPLVRDPHAVNLFGNPTGPGGSHPLGVDGSGRDVLSRILYGLRSLALITLAASALATLASAALAGLAALNPWLRWLTAQLVGALCAYPALLLGLAVGLSLSGAGAWRLIVPIALAQLCVLATPLALAVRQLPAAFARALSRAIGLDVGLTFLGLGPGGHGPQLGAMIAQAGTGIVAGVPAWWALLFPGLVVLAVRLGAQSLARELVPALTAPRPQPDASSDPPSPRPLAENPLADQLAGRGVQLIITVGLAVAAFSALGDANPGGGSALAGIGADLGASGSLVLGGLVVWALAVWLHLRLITRGRPRGSGRGRRLGSIPAALLAAAPVGWLAFLAIDVFSESVGKLPVLPGAGAYVGLTHDPGRWADALVMPWLALGLTAAAGTVLALAPRVALIADSAQQRVARAAGVPEPALARQRRRALWAPLLHHLELSLPSFVGATLLLEATFRIPGAGTAILVAYERQRAATVSDLTLLVTVALIGAGLGLGALRILADPRAARR